MKLVEIFSQGYAGATMGGTSFMVRIELPEDRFPIKNEKKQEEVFLNVVIPDDAKNEKKRYMFVKRLFDSFWSEEEPLTKEEMVFIEAWIVENKIEEKAKEIKKEIKIVSKKQEALYKRKAKIFDIPFTTVENFEKNFGEIKKIEQEIKELQQTYDALHGK